jgi:hypothetical protein
MKVIFSYVPIFPGKSGRGKTELFDEGLKNRGFGQKFAKPVAEQVQARRSCAKHAMRSAIYRGV